MIENELYSDGIDEGKFWFKVVLLINYNDSMKERMWIIVVFGFS